MRVIATTRLLRNWWSASIANGKPSRC